MSSSITTAIAIAIALPPLPPLALLALLA